MTVRLDAADPLASPRNRVAGTHQVSPPVETTREGPVAFAGEPPPMAVPHDAEQESRSGVGLGPKNPVPQLVTPRKLVSSEDGTPRIVFAQTGKDVTARRDVLDKKVEAAGEQPSSSSKPEGEQQISTGTSLKEASLKPAEQPDAIYQYNWKLPVSSSQATSGLGLSSLVKVPATAKSNPQAKGSPLMQTPLHNLPTIPPRHPSTSAIAAAQPASSLAAQKKQANTVKPSDVRIGWPIPPSISAPSIIPLLRKTAVRETPGEAEVPLQPDKPPPGAISLPPGNWAVPEQLKTGGIAQVLQDLVQLVWQTPLHTSSACDNWCLGASLSHLQLCQQ